MIVSVAVFFLFCFFFLSVKSCEICAFRSRRVWGKVYCFQPFEGFRQTDPPTPLPAAVRDNRPRLLESFYEATRAVRPGETKER